MPRSTRTRVCAVAVGMTAVLVTAVGCGSDGAADSDSPVTLNLSTFGNFGYSDELFEQFEAEHPGIDVVHNIAAGASEARTAMFTRLAAGSGLADVEAVESNWTVELAQYSDLFHPVPENEEFGDWVDFQAEPVTAEDGSLFAYGVAIGPSAICYRSDLLEAAGLPTDPAEVAALLKGDWDNFFKVGRQYQAGGGDAWFDSAENIFNSRISQQANPYEEDDGTIIATSNPQVKQIFRDTLAVAPDLSAGLETGSDDWRSAMNSGEFATIACPSWFLGIIKGAAPEVTTWRVADVFPGGGRNNGGSYLVVPKQGEHPEEAALLASWLTAPERQVKAFTVAGAFPSRVEAYELPELREIVNPYFGDAPVGEIFVDRAEAIDEVVYKGPKYFQINEVMVDAFTRVETGAQSIDDAWEQAVREIEALK